MPLDNYFTKPDFSRQIKQYSGTTAILSGETNILEKFSVKSIEIDTAGANDGDALIYDLISNKFSSNVPGTLGSRVINGLILTYNNGLTYNVSQGTYRINSILYGYVGGTINITSGLTSGSRFDVVFITSAATALVSAGTTAINPSIPQINISGGELEVGIIFVPANFSGGTGTTIIQSTGSTFEFNNGAASAGIQRQGGGAAATGDYSFASNFQAKASGNYSSAIGYYAEATGTSQTVVGQFNTPDEGYFIVGNGESSGSRSNAFRVTTGGSAYVTNKLFVTNIEIETTGASSNFTQPLAFDGTKFKPQENIKLNQLSGTSIFLSSGFTFISGYNSYSNPSELRVLLADDLGSIESKTDTYQLNYFTENITKGINPLTRGIYSAFTGGPIFGYIRTGTSITVGKESFVKITGITSGDTAIGTVFRNRFETKDYEATNTLDNTTKNIVGTAFFNQIDSSKFNQNPFVGTLVETHLLGNQQRTYHNEVRNLQLGMFNRAWVYTTSAQTYFDLYINRPLVNNSGYNSYDNNNIQYSLRLNKHAGIFIESREKISSNDILNRPLNLVGNPTPVVFENKPWSLFAEADRAYIGSTLVLYSGLTLSSTTRGAWLDIDASQATRPHINLSAGTNPTSPQIGDLWWNGTELYFRKDASTSVNLLSGGTGSITSGSGSTSGTSLGNGVKVLFSSDTTSLSFATLSSQTPSTLSIISSSTGVILFSVTGGTGSTLTGNFLPLSGGTLTGGLSATTISATSIDRLDYIDFNTGASVTQNFGRTFFNGTEQTLSYYGEGITEIKVGQQLYSRVYNNTGSILTKGTAVKVTGATQGLPTVCAAIATHTGENTVIGLVANNIANNSSGLVINNGLISGLTLNNFVVGDTLYLSPVSAGTYVNSLSGYGFNIRTNVIGRVVATGTTTGQIYVKTDNEDSTLSLTNLERNIVEGNAISTGVYEFTGITTGSTNTTFNISPVRGWITYNTYQYATNPEVTNVFYSGGTNLTTPFLTSNTQTYILLTSAGTISYQTTFPTPQQRRENIYLGKLGHGTRTTILNVFNEPDSDISPLSQLRDIFTPIKLINDGVLVSANGSNLNINTSAGILYGMGIGFATNQLNPNSITVNATTPTTFQYRTQTGGTGGPYSSTTLIDPLFYDLNGARIAVGTPAKQATNQRIFMLQNGQFRIQYGQAKYSDLATAIAAVQTESFTTFQNFRDNAILIGVLSVESDTTALNNTAKARFTFASKFGEVVGGTGGIATTTLQQAYDNSVTPEIVTSTNGALSIQNGTGNADSATNLLEGQNTAGSVTSFIRADGTISGLTFLGDASNLTGVLSKTLLTENIPVTSQVAQVNTFYLYDKLTITSSTPNVTVTSITSDVSISAYTPSIKFFANTGVTVTFQNSATLKTEGGLDAVIVGNNYDSVTFTYNNNIQKYFQTNINNYI